MVPVTDRDPLVDAWLRSLVARHATSMTRPEFLKAARALSARYVERRAALADRSPLDSAGKRAAFAGFYAPMHFLAARAIVQALGPLGAPVTHIVDLGCGTGVAGAAWALQGQPGPSITGVDRNTWALDEARSTWRALDLPGRARRADVAAVLDELLAPRRAAGPDLGLVLGWSVNELDARARARAQRALLTLAGRGARILVIEPIAARLVPWWDEWADQSVEAGGRVDSWRLQLAVPDELADLSRDAGFARDALTARSVAFNWR